MSRATTATALSLAAAAALLGACSSPGQSPAPSTTTASTPSTSTTAADNAMKVVGGPLVAADLPGWKSTTLALGAEWVHGCGEDTQVGALQSTAKVSAIMSPSGIPVVTRIATYKPGQAAQALQNAQTLFTDCPIENVGGGQRTLALMNAPAGQQAVGALVSTLDASGQTTDEVGYWVAKVGDATVEVYAHGKFIATGATDPMDTFSSAIRDAALAKALGQHIPAVTVPQTQVAAAAASAASAQNNPSGAASAAANDPAGVDPGVAGNSLTNGSFSGLGTPAPSQPGVGGESGPGVIMGTEAPGAMPSPAVHK